MIEKCKICGNTRGNKIYLVRERMLNMGHSFRYIYCKSCHTLHLIDPVKSIADYYAKDYEPFTKKHH